MALTLVNKQGYPPIRTLVLSQYQTLPSPFPHSSLTVDVSGGVDGMVRAYVRHQAYGRLNTVVRVVTRGTSHQVLHSRPVKHGEHENAYPGRKHKQ